MTAFSPPLLSLMLTSPSNCPKARYWPSFVQLSVSTLEDTCSKGQSQRHLPLSHARP